jgi:hypothetical protein
MEFTFHTSYVILDLVPSTVILWTELSYWRKSYSNQATLPLDWSHRYKNSTVAITIWLTAWNIHISNDNGSFTFYVDVFLPLSLPRLSPDLTVYIWATRQVFYYKQGMLTLQFAMTRVHPRVFGGVRVAHLFSFLCCPIICLYVLSSVLWCPLRFPHKSDVRFVFAFRCL